MKPTEEMGTPQPRFIQEQQATIQQRQMQQQQQQTRAFSDIRGTQGIPRNLGGPTFQEQVGAWSRSISETWVGPSTAEDVLRDVFLFWQPRTEERRAREKAYWESKSPKETERIYRQRAQQGEVAVIGAALIAPVAFYAAEKVGPQIKEYLRFSSPAKVLHKVDLAIKEKVPFWKIYEPFKKGVAPGEVGGKLIERFGLTELEASAFEFEMMQQPRMGSVYIAQVRALSEETEKPFSYLMKGIMGWVTREATFTPLVSQTVLTRMGIQPYSPTKPFLTTENLAEEIIGSGWKGQSLLTGVAGALGFPFRQTLTKPSTFQPIIQTPRLLQPQTQRAIERQRQSFIQPFRLSQVQTPSQVVDQVPKQRQVLTPSQAIIQVQKQVQKQMQALISPTPTSTIPKNIFAPFFRLPSGGEGGKGGTKGLFGKWFRKSQQIKTPQQMLQTFFGTPTKRKRKAR